MSEEMIAIFEEANRQFLEIETIHGIPLGVSERSLCGSLMLHLRKALDKSAYKEYYVDIEYNRNEGGELKTIVNGIETAVKITCDLIVHSRGGKPNQDNLIAVEMKRSTHREREKEKDKTRLICLTRDSYDNIWPSDGKTLPEHVCGYILGVYYELDSKNQQARIKYYTKGEMNKRVELPFSNCGDTA